MNRNEKDGMICYLNESYLPHHEARIAPWDHGFMLGVGVAELMRTFGAQVTLLDRHLARMEAGLEQLGLDHRQLKERGHDIPVIIAELLSQNLPLISAGCELSISLTVTPGAAAYAMPDDVDFSEELTVLAYTRELEPQKWAQIYQDGYRLSTVKTIEAPPQMLPKVLKSRSRMHYYLAEREATKIAPGTRALMLDVDGNVAEGTTASIVAVIAGELIAPPQTDVLSSVSFSFVKELAGKLSIPVRQQTLSLKRLRKADEILWLSTPMCLAPVTELDGQTIGGPGPIFKRLIAAWSEAVGVGLLL